MAVLKNPALPPVVVITAGDPVQCANGIHSAWQAFANPRWFASNGTSAVSIAAVDTQLDARIGAHLY